MNNQHSHRSRYLLLLALVAPFTLSGYNCNDVLDDPGFDLWCDDQLCTWTLESGEVARVQTWHESDFGVELVGPDVAISQLANRNNFSCLRFELIADIEETAEVTLELDFYNDGQVEYTERIPTASWEELSYQVRMPPVFDDLLFRIRKTGHGRAVLAEIAALSEGDCSGLDPVPQFAGAICDRDGGCVDNVCAEDPGLLSVCGMCQDASDCQSGQACGIESDVSGLVEPYPTCVPEASHGLGQRCREDAECATGICAGLVCSSCRDDGDCAQGSTCQARADELGRAWSFPPNQCDPRAMMAASGDACLTDDDCQSGVCDGQSERRLCLSDSRSCAVDADCETLLVDASDERAVCVTVGRADGICQ